MEKVIQMTYASSLTNLCDVNASFDRGVLRVAYHGENRNHSYISKDVFEKSMKSMFNCPIVCNYDRDSDTLGGHDVEIVRDDDGSVRIVNCTTPVGCIPESAKTWWDTVEEEDGTKHEYLFVEVLLWKRQEAYRKIRKNGITAHSMEITVRDGETIDGVFHIYSFEYTAFALIGVEPCFESSALEVFSAQDFKRQLTEMMNDLKESFQLVTSSNEDDDTHPHDSSAKGGKEGLEEKMALLAELGIDAESLDFDVESVTIEELRRKAEEALAKVAHRRDDEDDAASDEDKPSVDMDKSMVIPDDGQDDTVTHSLSDTQDDISYPQPFSLSGEQLRDGLRSALAAVVMDTEFGEMCRYCYVDYSTETSEVYCYDMEDWNLYGFTYSMNGDNVVIDFASKARKKFSIVDFDEGEQQSAFASVFAAMNEKYSSAAQKIAAYETELTELRAYRQAAEDKLAQNQRDEVFGRFADLTGIEAFEALRENCADLSVDALEEKCFAIRGRNGIQAKFSADNKAPKLKIEKHQSKSEPYGGIFAEYGYGSDE